MESLYFFAFALIGLVISMLPCWAVLSFPNYWLKNFSYIPAKRLSFVYLLCSFAVAYLSNLELEGGIITAFIFSSAFCFALALMSIVLFYFHNVFVKISKKA